MITLTINTSSILATKVKISLIKSTTAARLLSKSLSASANRFFKLLAFASSLNLTSWSTHTFQKLNLEYHVIMITAVSSLIKTYLWVNLMCKWDHFRTLSLNVSLVFIFRFNGFINKTEINLSAAFSKNFEVPTGAGLMGVIESLRKCDILRHRNRMVDI